MSSAQHLYSRRYLPTSNPHSLLPLALGPGQDIHIGRGLADIGQHRPVPTKLGPIGPNSAEAGPNLANIHTNLADAGQIWPNWGKHIGPPMIMFSMSEQLSRFGDRNRTNFQRYLQIWARFWRNETACPDLCGRHAYRPTSCRRVKDKPGPSPPPPHSATAAARLGAPTLVPCARPAHRHDACTTPRPPPRPPKPIMARGATYCKRSQPRANADRYRLRGWWKAVSSRYYNTPKSKSPPRFWPAQDPWDPTPPALLWTSTNTDLQEGNHDTRPITKTHFEARTRQA